MHEAPYIRGLGDEIYSLCYPSILNLVNIGSVRPMNIMGNIPLFENDGRKRTGALSYASPV